jgi:hypothetical protein
VRLHPLGSQEGIVGVCLPCTVSDSVERSSHLLIVLPCLPPSPFEVKRGLGVGEPLKNFEIPGVLSAYKCFSVHCEQEVALTNICFPVKPFTFPLSATNALPHDLQT